MAIQTLNASAAAELREDVIQRMRAHGLRPTRTRRCLVEVLIEAGRPLTVDAFLALGPGLAMSSVYRDLSQFCDAGIVERLTLLDDRQHYQFAPSVLGHRQLHFVCVECQSITTIESPLAVAAAVRRAEGSAAGSDVVVGRSRLTLTGRCRSCGAPRG
jgi:Fe2+ or Zn2+ uptake regulation protein